MFWIPHGVYFDQNDTQRHKCNHQRIAGTGLDGCNNDNTQDDPGSMCDEAFLINNILLEIEQNIQSSNLSLSFGKYSFKVAPNGKYTVRTTDERNCFQKH